MERDDSNSTPKPLKLNSKGEWVAVPHKGYDPDGPDAVPADGQPVHVRIPPGVDPHQLLKELREAGTLPASIEHVHRERFRRWSRKIMAQLESVWESIADPDNPEPFPKDFLVDHSDAVAWAIGQNPGYEATVLEAKILRPAFVDRIRKILESRIAGSPPAPVSSADTPEDPSIHDPAPELMVKLSKQSQAICRYLWKRSLVSRDELRRNVWKGKSAKDKTIDAAVNYLEQQLGRARCTQTRIDKGGGGFYLKHPEK